MRDAGEFRVPRFAMAIDARELRVVAVGFVHATTSFFIASPLAAPLCLSTRWCLRLCLSCADASPQLPPSSTSDEPRSLARQCRAQ